MASESISQMFDPTDDEAVDRFHEWLRRTWALSRERGNAKWNRTLPFGEYVVDRWTKAQALGFGEGASIYDSAVVIGEVCVGANTWVGPNVVLDGSGGLSIGSYCSISAGVQIYSHDSVEWARSGGAAEYAYKATTIGDCCYLGPNVVVAKGVTIGNRCVIGANSLVLQSIPEGSTAFGTPCTVR